MHMISWQSQSLGNTKDGASQDIAYMEISKYNVHLKRRSLVFLKTKSSHNSYVWIYEMYESKLNLNRFESD